MTNIFSYSQLNTFHTCPQQYRFQRIDKVEIPDRVSADIFLGNAIHSQLETAYKLGQDNKLYPLVDMLKAFRETWDKTGREKIEVSGGYLTIDDYIATGEKLLTRYYEQYQPFDQGILLGAELNITFDLTNTPFRFRAKIDRLWKREDGTVEICDYKTGKRLPLGVHDRGFFLQMGIYQLAVQASYPQYEKIEVAQYFLRHEEVIRHSFTPEELDEMTEHLRIEALAIQHAIRLDSFPTNEGGYCNFCRYETICPAKRHRLILDDEESKDAEERTTAEVAADRAAEFLEVDAKLKETKAKHDALKGDLIAMAEELHCDKFSTDSGAVTVKGKTEEKFITKSADEKGFAELSSLVRQWKLDEAFKLDNTVLLKDFYLAQRLPDEQLKQLKEFIVEKKQYRIAARPKKIVEEM